MVCPYLQMTNTSGMLAVERDDGDKGSWRIIAIGDVVETMARKVGASVGWPMTTPPEEVDFSESLIRCFHFLTTGEVEGMAIGGTTTEEDDGVDEKLTFFCWVKGPSTDTVSPGPIPYHWQ